MRIGLRRQGFCLTRAAPGTRNDLDLTARSLPASTTSSPFPEMVSFAPTASPFEGEAVVLVGSF